MKKASLSEETGEGQRVILHLFLISYDSRVIIDNRIPFIKYFPIVFVMNISYFSCFAMIYRVMIVISEYYQLIFTAGSDKSYYEHWLATDVAMIGNRDNDTPVQSQHERDKRFRREAVAGNEGGRVRTTWG